jgi:hypothetical protein
MTPHELFYHEFHTRALELSVWTEADWRSWVVGLQFEDHAAHGSRLHEVKLHVGPLVLGATLFRLRPTYRRLTGSPEGRPRVGTPPPPRSPYPPSKPQW